MNKMSNQVFKTIIYISIFFAAASKNEANECQPNNTISIKRFKIDLDLPPAERFKESTAYFKDPLLNFYAKEIKLKIDPAILILLESIAKKLDYFYPYPFNEEIQGITDALETSLGDVIVANLIYEFTAFCTSIVAQQKNGQIIHGRNFDYDFSSDLQNVTFIAEYYRDGELLFTSAQPAGYIGAFTGHKYKKFTFSLNERDQGSWLVNLLFALLDKKASPIASLTRHIMENATSYAEAVQFAKETDLIAPVYFIVAGVNPGEGAIITRNQFKVVDEWKLNSTSTGIEKWYLLETNYDHWIPPPPDDDRQTPGMKAMKQIGQDNINLESLMTVISTKPICNRETVYSVTMSAIEKAEYGFNMIVH